MYEDITWVGIDDHKKKLYLAVLKEDSPESDVKEYQIPTEQGAVRRMVRKLKREFGGKIRCVYEAGPLGYTLQRWVGKAGAQCEVAAPSRTPRRAGERIKTDRRDARKLVTLYRGGLLRMIVPPSDEDEAFRDLARQRDQAGRDLRTAKHRLGKFLLRRGLIWQKKAWTREWERWVRTLKFDDPLSAMILDEYQQQYEERRKRLEHLDELIGDAAMLDRFKVAIAWLRCFRGIDTVTAFALATTLYTPERFRGPEYLMSFIGLVVSESTTGGRRRQGAITKEGNSLLRRLLVESAKHQRLRVTVSRDLRARRQGQPDWVIHLADKAMTRLHRQYTRLIYRGKHPNVAATAVAREMVGYIWEILQSSSTATATAKDVA